MNLEPLELSAYAFAILSLVILCTNVVQTLIGGVNNCGHRPNRSNDT